MPKVICPVCKNTYLKSRANFWNEDVCSSCFRKGERTVDTAKNIATDSFLNQKSVVKNESDQLEIGKAAAFRTIKYSTIFERIGFVIERLNNIGVVILVIFGFFLDVSGVVFFAYYAGILILWIIGYVQTALIRGISSYFQMKASEFLIRNN